MVDIDLNIPFECMDEYGWDSDVSVISLTSTSDSQNSTQQQPEEGEEGNNNNINALSSPINQSRELGNDKKKLIVQQLMFLQKDGRLPRGAINESANQWGVCRTTIWRLWSAAKKAKELGVVLNVNCKRKGKAGKKPKAFDMERLKAIPIEKRTTIRGVAHALGIGHSSVYRMMKAGIIKSHTNSIKPKLSPSQKHKRLEFILTQIIPPSVHTIPKFSLMFNVIHMDEKFFYMSRETQRFYLFHSDIEHEEEPHRCVQNKHYISKVMFLAAVARPHIAAEREVLWDGKIGIFPITEQHVAVRSSGNRPAGTIEERAIARVTRDVIRAKLIEEVLPSIRAKWPANSVKDIFIQQDNARPHILCNDAEFMNEATKEGFNIRLVCQPASSPDMNILDLGFFNAIQSIQFKAFPKDVGELIKAVKDAYDSYHPTLLNYTWIQLHLTMLEVLKVRGGNTYKAPHIGKEKLNRMGLLPQQIDVPIDLIESTKQILQTGIIDLNVPMEEQD